MKKIRSIELVFENCDSVMVPQDRIGDIIIRDISTEISRIACNAVGETESAGFVAIEIFGKKNDETGTMFGYGFFDRVLAANDITHVEIAYGDNETPQGRILCVKYSDEGPDSLCNRYQKTYLSKAGNLYILICREDWKIHDIFPGDIDNPAEMETKRKMIMG